MQKHHQLSGAYGHGQEESEVEKLPVPITALSSDLFKFTFGISELYTHKHLYLLLPNNVKLLSANNSLRHVLIPTCIIMSAMINVKGILN